MWYGSPGPFQLDQSSLEPSPSIKSGVSQKNSHFWRPVSLDRCLELAKIVPSHTFPSIALGCDMAHHFCTSECNITDSRTAALFLLTVIVHLFVSSRTVIRRPNAVLISKRTMKHFVFFIHFDKFIAKSRFVQIMDIFFPRRQRGEKGKKLMIVAKIIRMMT